MVVRPAIVIAVAVSSAGALVVSCGSKTDTHDPPVRRMSWVKGDCGIPSQPGCVDFIQVGFAACGLVLANEAGVSETRVLSPQSCSDLVAPVLREDIRRAVNQGNAGKCTGKPTEYFELTYEDDTKARLELNGCAGDPYDTIRRVRESVRAQILSTKGI